MGHILADLAQMYRGCPERIAYSNQLETLTYRELWEQSSLLAAWLRAKTSYEGQSTPPVAVYGHMEMLMPVCFLAALKAGRGYVPIDSSFPQKRVEQILLSSGTDCVLSPIVLPRDFLPAGPLADKIRIADATGQCGTSIQEIVSNATLHAVDLNRGGSGSVATAISKVTIPASNLNPVPYAIHEASLFDDSLIYVIYTSGSTGKPKGVPINHRNLLSFTNWLRHDFPFTSDDVVLNQAPFSFDLSVMGLYPALLAGAALWATDRTIIANPKQLFSAFRESNLSVWISTPSFADFCLMDPAFSRQLLPRLRLFLFCGEILPAKTVRKLMQRFPGAIIVNMYGPTEATVAVTSVILDQDLLDAHPNLPVGRCKPDCRIRIYDEAGQEVSAGEKGEVVILGASVSGQYLSDPERSAKSFFRIHDSELGETHAYKTGDLGYLEGDQLFCCGRIDFQIKLHGYRIELEEIEQRLRELPGIKTGAVVPRMKDGICQYLSAYIVPDEWPTDETAAVADWKAQLADFLPQYMLPRVVLLRPELPLNGNGKLDRNVLFLEATS